MHDPSNPNCRYDPHAFTSAATIDTDFCTCPRTPEEIERDQRFHELVKHESEIARQERKRRWAERRRKVKIVLAKLIVVLTIEAAIFIASGFFGVVWDGLTDCGVFHATAWIYFVANLALLAIGAIMWAFIVLDIE
jgi:hypothetical protein